MKKIVIQIIKTVTIFLFIGLTNKTSAQNTIANWSFPNASANAIVDASTPANSSASISCISLGNPLALTFPNGGAGNGSDKCATATNWTGGAGSVYWTITISTIGYSGIELSSKQASLATGPRDFKVAYQIGSGPLIDLAGATNIQCSTVFTATGTGNFNNIALPSTCDNQSSLTIRWILNSSTAQNGGAIATSGTSKIDDILIRGNNGNFYRSLTTGNWNAPSTWQSSTDNVNWATASTAPNNASNKIQIRSGHTVTVNTAVSADQITIDFGGTLNYTSGTNATKMTLNDGSGIDLQVNGTFINASNSSGNAAPFSFTTGSTWVLGASGTYIQSNGNSSDDWATYYYNNISSIPASANWILRNSGTSPSVTTIPPSGSMYYPNLTLEGSVIWTNGQFTGTSDYPRILGNFDIGGNGTQPVSFTNDCSFSTPISVGGNLTIRTGSSLTLGGNANGSGGFDLKGNLLIDGTLLNSNASWTFSSRMIMFTGAGAQTISGSGSIASINMVVVNKSSGHVTLSMPMPISANLTLTHGNLITTSANLPTLANDATVAGASDNSFVDGPIAAAFSGNSALTFPTGKDGLYHPIMISNIPGAGTGTTTFTAEYFGTGPNQAAPIMPETSLGTGINHISSCEFWNLSKSGGTRTASVGLGWRGTCSNVQDIPSLKLAYWSGSLWSDIGPVAPAAGSTASPGSGSITSVANATTYSSFTLGSSTNDNPLPITLIDFTGKPLQTGNQLDWSCSSEKNNACFNIERAEDMIHFEVIGEAKGIGSTEAISRYSFTDKHPLLGINYYRLHQFDFDGTSDMSDIIAVDANAAGKNYTLINDAYNKQLILRLQKAENNGEVSVFDLLGRMRISQLMPAGQDVLRLDCSQLEHGIYLLMLNQNGESQAQEFCY